MLTYNAGLIPHCDVHRDREMDLRDLKTHDVEALVYKCSVTGCRKYFHPQFGEGSDIDRVHRCDRVLTFVVLDQEVGGSAGDVGEPR